MATAIWAIGLIITASVFSALGTFCLKLASPHIALKLKKIITLKMLWAGLVLYGIGVILSLFAFRAGELSILYPFIALQYIWTSLLSMKYLEESMGAAKWFGVALIVLGVALVGIGA